jgi:hypothetical protein
MATADLLGDLVARAEEDELLMTLVEIARRVRLLVRDPS